MPTAAPVQARMKPVLEENFSLFSTILLSVDSTSGTWFINNRIIYRAEVLSRLFNNCSNITEPLPGSLQGQTSIQIAQPYVFTKYGMHLSKLTYHLLLPRTSCFSFDKASGGQSITQR